MVPRTVVMTDSSQWVMPKGNENHPLSCGETDLSSAQLALPNGRRRELLS